MSKSNIGSSIYDFDFSLTRIITGVTGDKDKYNFIPISKAAVLYLEVEDNLAKFGCQGKVILNNFYSILDKAGLGAGINQGVTLFDINFTNLDFDAFKKATLLDKSFQIVTQLGLGNDDSKNSIDKNLTFDFEEYAVSVLRQKKVDPVTLTNDTQLTKLIQNLLATGVDIKEKNLYVQAKNFTDSPIVVPISQVIKPAQSFYDLISFLYKYLWYPEQNSPGILQLENFVSSSGEYIQRSFVLKPLCTFIKKFYDKITNGDTDLEEYVLERFVIGGELEEPTLRENTIDDYNISHADIDTLLKTTWANHKAIYLTSDNITDTTTDLVKYEEMRELFNRTVLTGKYTINTPLVPTAADTDPSTDQVITHDYVCDFKEGVDETIIRSGIQAMMFRSFIFDNSSITFKTVGSPYRNPGMFILLNDDKPDEEAKEAPTGYWFVISVKHIFENDIYQNEITAVKFCVNKK
jgi:hypothetical protein